MRRGTRSAIIHLGIICIAMTIVALVGKKNGIRQQESNAQAQGGITTEGFAYSEYGNQQGAIQTGGYQVYLSGRGTVINCLNKLYCFDEVSQTLVPFCNKSGCLHTGDTCSANQRVFYLMNYFSDLYGVSQDCGNEIWRCRDSEWECWYRADDKIIGLWRYRGYLYYMTGSGVFRISVEKSTEPEQVLDQPVLYEMLNFYKDKMYFVTEDEFLYEAYCDGSGKQRMTDERAAFPQIGNGVLYYRSLAYDVNGIFQQTNTLRGISLEDGQTRTILDSVYRFSVVEEENKIYYVQLTDLSVSRKSFLQVLDMESGTSRRLTECLAVTELGTFPESDWIVLQMPEAEDEACYYCIKKDGSGKKQLAFPEEIKR